ncbi:MAG: hydroxymethylglutaryl-CoA lyase [Bacteroidetes bacterium HGW-Bacteroidetes-17]|jgi:hydroxymethylglutaryl-CoA lyase|nr:MAG: hydroxymethylglutaryl-CoA lyase [Bacteroidetes bacterium HGW-Bacteroidetes-17]
MIKIIETVRDGFQGLKPFIPTANKIEYINALLKVGFDAIDVGSFVSEKAVPQMTDTAEVIRNLDLSGTKSKIMVLVGNEKGAITAVGFEQIDQLIYPFSISESFLKKNINADFKKAENDLDDIVNICNKHHKELVVYLTMGFGNPYGDTWNLEIIHHWIERLIVKGVKIIPLSDITGESTPEKIKEVYTSIIPAYPDIEFGFHLHSSKDTWFEKVDSAYHSGVERFDTVIGGMGGCPMTGYELLSNLNTNNLYSYFEDKNIETQINKDQFELCSNLINNLF